MYLFTLSTAVPESEVTVTAPNNQTVGQPLMLTCNAVTVRGITSNVDIIWRRDGTEVNKTINVLPTMITSSLVYTDTYTISLLSTDDDGREYQCELVINTSPPVIATDSVTLDVMSKFDGLNYELIISLSFNSIPDYFQCRFPQTLCKPLFT